MAAWTCPPRTSRPALIETARRYAVPDGLTTAALPAGTCTM
jgi:hypothetical protein